MARKVGLDSIYWEIIDLYLYGFNATELGVLYTCSSNTVLALLKKHNIKSRASRSMFTTQREQEILREYNNGISSIKLATEYGCSVNTILATVVKLGGTTKPCGGIRQHFFNERYFEHIDTHEKAYFLGFIAADGCLMDSISGAAVTIAIQARDGYLLDSLREQVGYAAPYRFTNKGYAILNLYSNPMKEDLRKYGIHQNKSLTLVFPNNIPEKYLNSYMLGYFDGDGCICLSKIKDKMGRVSPSFGITGTYEFCESYQGILVKECGARVNTIQHNSENSFVFQQGSFNTIKSIYEYLYSGCSFFLHRKKEKFEKLFRMVDDGHFRIASTKGNTLYT